MRCRRLSRHLLCAACSGGVQEFEQHVLEVEDVHARQLIALSVGRRLRKCVCNAAEAAAPCSK